MSNNNDNKAEQYKEIVDGIFKKLEEAELSLTNKLPKLKKVEETPKKKASEYPPLRLDPQKVEEARRKQMEKICNNTEDVAEAAIEMALEEIEIVRQAFIEFQEQTHDLAIFQFLYPQIEKFIEFCMDLEELIQDDFDVESMEEETLAKYQKMQKLRARILSAMYMKYKKEE